MIRSMDLFSTPPFATFALFSAALCVLLILIDSAGGGVRASTKTTLNPEDVSTVSKGAKLVDADPERVARVMRAHRNALANIIPFWIVMFLYVALGATQSWVLGLSGVFLGARVVHAAVYIRGVQPWRTISFVVGQTCTGVAVVQVIRAALALL
jgi:uncharacterized MAPEG superfamily protein